MNEQAPTKNITEHCRRCIYGDHARCETPLDGGPRSGFMLGCCCDLLDDEGTSCAPT
jgi:hypothetical protein